MISSPSGIGGAEQVMLSLVRDGDARGTEQRILHPFARRGETQLAELAGPGSYFARPASHWREVPRVRAWLERQLHQFDPEIVHAHLFHALVLVASLPRRTRTRLVLTHHHGSRYVDESQLLRERLDRICGRRYDVVVAVSEATRRMLVDRYRYPESKLRTIPNGWSGTPRDPVEHQGQRIICVANFRAQKGHEVLLAAFAKSSQRIPRAELVLVGDGPLRSEIEAQAARLGVAERVRFEGSVSDVWPLLAQADVFALASRYEPLGIAALEAMAAGLPIVATRVGGLTDLVIPGINGELVAPDDPDGLAQQLVALLRSPQLLAAMGSASRERAAAHHANRMTTRYFELYRELTESAHAAAPPMPT